jgi:hypothetical protein
MNGRVYDPYLGRFLSADTVIQSLGATESINPYAYAWNDPLKYIDPSGHSLLGDVLEIVAAVITCGAIAAVELAIYGAALTAVSMAAIAGFVGGFVGALVATGSLSAALTAGLISGITAALTAGVTQQGSRSKSWVATGPRQKESWHGSPSVARPLQRVEGTVEKELLALHLKLQHSRQSSSSLHSGNGAPCLSLLIRAYWRRGGKTRWRKV